MPRAATYDSTTSGEQDERTDQGPEQQHEHEQHHREHGRHHHERVAGRGVLDVDQLRRRAADAASTSASANAVAQLRTVDFAPLAVGGVVEHGRHEDLVAVGRRARVAELGDAGGPLRPTRRTASGVARTR